MIRLTSEPIDTQQLLLAVASPAAGAVVLFAGTVREMTGDRQTAWLEYECYPAMAERQMSELEAEARRRWPLVECALVHRLGRLELGETCVVIAVSAPHRRAAFEAAEWLIDTLKQIVPIWKKEHWADGSTEWIHPQPRNGQPMSIRETRDGEPRMDGPSINGPNTDEPRIDSVAQPREFARRDDRARPRVTPAAAPLVDSFGRVHADLRISVTDRCNLRCFYCMPAGNVLFKPRAEILSFEEIERFVRMAARLGVCKLRLTGGEPLARRDLPALVKRLARVEGIDEIALTTNGLLLGEQAQPLKDAGLDRLNISLDTLRDETFREIARRDGLERVLAGIFAARRAGFEQIKLNCVAIRGVTEPDIVPLARFAREHAFELRFIEFMPLDAEGKWANEQVLSGDEIRGIIERAIAPLQPLAVVRATRADGRRADIRSADGSAARGDSGEGLAVKASQPATDYRFADGQGRIGFINPVTHPFCANCDRLRLTADGQVRNCLFSIEEWDARRVLRSGGSDDQLAALVRACVAAKQAGHGINSDEFLRPARAMFQIGG